MRIASNRWGDFWIRFPMLWSLERVPWALELAKPMLLFLTWRTSRLLRRNLRANARRLLGPESSSRSRTELSKRVLANFFDFIVELGRSKQTRLDELEARISRIEGHEQYLAERAQRRGAILVTAHLGAFETGVAAIARHEREVHVVFRRDLMPRFERLRSAQRRKLGVIEAPVDDGLDVWIRLRDALRKDAVVLMQGDRVMPGQKGRRMPFLDGHMMIPTGPVKLAMASGAAIIPVFAPREQDGRVRIILEQPIPVTGDFDSSGDHSAIERLTRVIERFVREYPDQWLAVHRAWCEDAEDSP